MFTQAVVTLPSGKTLTVNGTGAADNAPYVQSATWNGAAWNNAYAPAGAITAGGTLGFTLGTAANTRGRRPPRPPRRPTPGTPGYTDAGVSDDSASSSADFDGGGYSYSAQALASAGVTPGATLHAGGATFTWPTAASGKPDNYEANGQTVAASGSGAISFLGAANNGPSSGTATVRFTDGTSQNVQINLSDWTLGGGAGTAVAGNTTAATAAYRNQAGAGSDAVKTYLFATAPAALASGKTVSEVKLPGDVNAGGMHVFAVGFGGSAVAGPVLSAVAANLCVDDANSATTDGNPVRLWGCNGSTAQQWTVGGDNTVRALGGCLDVSNSGTADGTKVQWYGCNGSGAQQWSPGTNGSLVNPASGKCLDDPNSSTTAGTQLQIYTCNGTTAQRWTIP